MQTSCDTELYVELGVSHENTETQVYKHFAHMTVNSLPCNKTKQHHIVLPCQLMHQQLTASVCPGMVEAKQCILLPFIAAAIPCILHVQCMPWLICTGKP